MVLVCVISIEARHLGIPELGLPMPWGRGLVGTVYGNPERRYSTNMD